MRVALIGCGKEKTAKATQARNLYTGALFQKSLAVAEKTCDAVAVLSAKHGLVQLDQIIEPYDFTLTDMRPKALQAWYAKVNAELITKYRGGWFVYFAGRVYCDGLLPGETPMQGLGIGRRLKWLNEQLKPRRVVRVRRQVNRN